MKGLLSNLSKTLPVNKLELFGAQDDNECYFANPLGKPEGIESIVALDIRCC